MTYNNVHVYQNINSKTCGKIWPIILHWLYYQTYYEKNSDGQQFHQYLQHEQSPPNNDGQQFHKYQQSEQLPLNSDDQ